MNRRELLKMGGMFAAGTGFAGPPAYAQTKGRAGLRLFDVRDHGAKGDGVNLDTSAINEAIAAANAGGGGIVYLGPGTYLTGTVVLRSNVTLCLEAGATLLGSKKISDYLPNSGPPRRGDANQKHLIFARDAENIGVVGPGRIDGQGPAFWVPSGRAVPPPEESWRDVATYDWKPLDRPSPLLEFYRCRNLRIENVRIENAPGWTMRPIECDGLFVHGITIKNPVIGPNTDGIDLTCSRNVFISDCRIDTGDDAICLKSESPYGGEPGISRNIVITNCVLTCCCNGLKFGTATRGGFENVTFSNSVIYNDDVDLKARVISGLALEMVDGGWLEGVAISNIQMQRVRTPIFIRRGNRRPRPDGTPGYLRGILIDNIHATGAVLTNSITGLPGFDVEDVTLSNIRIDSEEAGKADWVSRKISEVERSYPEARMFGRLPAYGFYCRHVKGLRLRQLELTCTPAEERPTVVCDDVKDFELEGFLSGRKTGSMPVIELAQTQEAFLHGCVAPAGTGTFLHVTGEKSRQIVVLNNNLAQSQKQAGASPEVDPSALTVAGNVGNA